MKSTATDVAVDFIACGMKTFPQCALILVCKAGFDTNKPHAPKNKVNPLVGRDGDKIDVFIGPHPHAELAYIVDAVDKDGGFDEHKTIVGALSEEEAQRIYLANYQAGWNCGKITALTMGQFKDWLMHGDKQKPVAGTPKIEKGVSGILVLVKSVFSNDAQATGTIHLSSPNLAPVQKQAKNSQRRPLTPQQHTAYRSVVHSLHPFIRVDSEVLPQVLRDGRFKSQHETGTSRGQLDADTRKCKEQQIFNVRQNADPKKSPIYGYLHQNHTGMDADESDNGDARIYGDAIVRLKNHMKDRTTFTTGDSLHMETEYSAPSHYHEPHPATLENHVSDWKRGRRAISGGEHTEAQYWGGVRKSDIDHVILPHHSETGRSKADYDNLEAICRSHGIPVRRNVKPMGRFRANAIKS